MEYARIIVPAAPVRRKSRHQSEMTSQLLFGEAVKVLKEKNSGWVKVKSLHDDYEGWLSPNLLHEVGEKDAKTPTDWHVAGMLNTIKLNDESLRVPMGAALPFLHEGKGLIGEWKYEVGEEAAVKTSALQTDEGKIRLQLIQWLNAPYQWGGRTILGVDCSGFVQVNYRYLGIDMPRDAWQQAQVGATVEKLKHATCGNLAFFDDKDEIVHVGILLDSEHIIHASGKVRIDKIDKKGIISSTTGKRTHSLRVIKKLW